MNTLTTALLDVRAFLAQAAQSEDFRNDAAWESGASHVENAASEALTRLDAVLDKLAASGCLGPSPDPSGEATRRAGTQAPSNQSLCA